MNPPPKVSEEKCGWDPGTRMFMCRADGLERELSQLREAVREAKPYLDILAEDSNYLSPELRQLCDALRAKIKGGDDDNERPAAAAETRPVP